MEWLRDFAITLAALVFVITTVAFDRGAHTVIKEDGRVSLIEIEGRCFLLYRGTGVANTICPDQER